MTEEDFKKMQDEKKQLLLSLGSINYSLDTIRVSLSILLYNLTENDKVKKLPAVDYEQMRQLTNKLAAIVTGASNDYYKNNVPGYQEHNPDTVPVPNETAAKSNTKVKDLEDVLKCIKKHDLEKGAK